MRGVGSSDGVCAVKKLGGHSFVTEPTKSAKKSSVVQWHCVAHAPYESSDDEERSVCGSADAGSCSGWAGSQCMRRGAVAAGPASPGAAQCARRLGQPGGMRLGKAGWWRHENGPRRPARAGAERANEGARGSAGPERAARAASASCSLPGLRASVARRFKRRRSRTHP